MRPGPHAPRVGATKKVTIFTVLRDFEFEHANMFYRYDPPPDTAGKNAGAPGKRKQYKHGGS